MRHNRELWRIAESLANEGGSPVRVMLYSWAVKEWLYVATIEPIPACWVN